MCGFETISTRRANADKTASAETPVRKDPGAEALLDDWYSDPEVLRRFGQVIAQSVWRPLGSQ